MIATEDCSFDTEDDVVFLKVTKAEPPHELPSRMTWEGYRFTVKDRMPDKTNPGTSLMVFIKVCLIFTLKKNCVQISGRAVIAALFIVTLLWEINAERI